MTEIVFCYHNCSDLLWEIIVLELEKLDKDRFVARHETSSNLWLMPLPERDFPHQIKKWSFRFCHLNMYFLFLFWYKIKFLINSHTFFCFLIIQKEKICMAARDEMFPNFLTKLGLITKMIDDVTNFRIRLKRSRSRVHETKQDRRKKKTKGYVS